MFHRLKFECKLTSVRLIECVKTRSCQLYAVDIQNTKDLTIYSLNTVAQKTMLNLNGKPLINAADNRNMFADTVVRFAIGDE